MNNIAKDIPAIALILFMAAGCMQKIHEPQLTAGNDKVLYIYEDGQMVFRSRFVHQSDVYLYDDGLGGERAAIKVRSPLHPDFYRDSTVIRMTSQEGSSIRKNDAVKQYQIN